jgi:hypothetical protein
LLILYSASVTHLFVFIALSVYSFLRTFNILLWMTNFRLSCLCQVIFTVDQESRRNGNWCNMIFMEKRMRLIDVFIIDRALSHRCK